MQITFYWNLLSIGIHRGDKVAIMTKAGSPYWTFYDFGAQQIGAILVPVHANVDKISPLRALKRCKIITTLVDRTDSRLAWRQHHKLCQIHHHQIP